jgi:hypothetical protein
VLCHHTVTLDPPILDWIINGRPDQPGFPAVPGPLSQLYLDKAGTFHLCAAGRSNHAGSGSWQGITDGNAGLIGIEALNLGDFVDPWPDAQLSAYARGCAAILLYLQAPIIMCVGHKEWRPADKIDPTLDMAAFRSYVQLVMNAMASGQAIPALPSNLQLPPPVVNPPPPPPQKPFDFEGVKAVLGRLLRQAN